MSLSNGHVCRQCKGAFGLNQCVVQGANLLIFGLWISPSLMVMSLKTYPGIKSPRILPSSPSNIMGCPDKHSSLTPQLVETMSPRGIIRQCTVHNFPH